MSTRLEGGDAEMVRAARSDPAAFDALYRRYLPAVFRYCRARVATQQDAEDVTAAVFVDALDGLAGYVEQGRFAAWLFTIARRQVSAHRRREVRGPVAGQVAPPAAPADLRLEDRDLLRRALGRLTEERREALALRFYAGLKIAEIAEVMGKGESAVKMLIHRGLGQLREELGEGDDG
jgi:RNA polymerase sigma-70 factor (ECF subfamily)